MSDDQLATAVERYIVGGPRDGNTGLIVGECLMVPADRPNSKPHQYRTATLCFPNYGIMNLLVSEDLTKEQARALVFQRILGGWPGVIYAPEAGTPR